MPDAFPEQDVTQPVGMRIYAKKMIEFLDANEVPYDEIDDGTRGKPPADFYIYDKGVRFRDNWAEIQAVIEWTHAQKAA